MPKKKDNISFDDAYTELNEITRHIQSGEIGIDDLSTKVKRAGELIKYCQDKLRVIEGELSNIFEEMDEESNG